MRWLVVAGVCGWVVAAAGAPTAAADDARAHYEHGNAAYALGHYAEAASEYEKAFQLHPDPALLFNAAQTHRLANNKPRALLLYQNYVRLYGDRVPNRADVERVIVKLRAAIASERDANTSPPQDTARTEIAPSHPAVTPPPPAATTAAAARPGDERPLIKRPWFWAVVGGAAVVVAVGLGVGLGVGLRGSERDPAPSYGTVSWP